MGADDETRARNRAAVQGAVEAINAGDAAAQMAHYTDDLVLEFPFADPPKRLESKDVVLPYLTTALGLFELDLSVVEVHETTDPDELDRRGGGHRHLHPERRALREPLRDRLRVPRRAHLPPAGVLQPARRPALGRRRLRHGTTDTVAHRLAAAVAQPRSASTRRKARRSATNCSGRSMQAKCPPRSCSFQWTMRYFLSAQARGVCISS